MKHIILATLIMQSAGTLLHAQSNAKADTMSIILNGERISLSVPKEGNKTTINLEDSATITQISVSKYAKLKSNAREVSAPPLQNHQAKRVSWLNEVEFGLITMAAKTYKTVNDTAYGFNFSIGGGGLVSNDRADVVKLTPKVINPGFSVGFSIREKTRKIGNTGLDFVTGSRFRYSRFTGSGQFEAKTIKASVKDGVITYYPDSVYATKSGEYKTVTSSFQLLFPFMVEKTAKNNVKFSIGMNLSIHVLSSKISQNIRDSYSIISYMNPQFIQLQPIVRVSYKRTSAYVSYNLGQSRVGYGSTQNTQGHLMYFGIGYKLY